MQIDPHRRDRGSVLLTVLIVVLAITVLGMAVVVGSGRHLTSARIRETNEGLVNCAMAVRQYISGAVAPGGAGLTGLNFTIPSTGTPITLKGGHYEAADGGFLITTPSTFGVKSASSVQNIANAMPMELGNTATQKTGSAVCTDPDGRTYEVEFSWIQ
jgi:hypothetical protein